MVILVAYDLTKSLTGAGEFAGCSHYAVARCDGHVRRAGWCPAERPGAIDLFLGNPGLWAKGS